MASGSPRSSAWSAWRRHFRNPKHLGFLARGQFWIRASGRFAARPPILPAVDGGERDSKRSRKIPPGENPSPTRILLISLAFNIKIVTQLEIMSSRYMSDAIQPKYGIFIGCYEHFLAMALDPVVFRRKSSTSALARASALVAALGSVPAGSAASRREAYQARLSRRPDWLAFAPFREDRRHLFPPNGSGGRKST